MYLLMCLHRVAHAFIPELDGESVGYGYSRVWLERSASLELAFRRAALHICSADCRAGCGVAYYECNALRLHFNKRSPLAGFWTAILECLFLIYSIFDQDNRVVEYAVPDHVVVVL